MKKICALAIVLGMMFSLAACGQKDFDAAGYVKASLDALYHGEYDAYAKFLDKSVEDVKKDIDSQKKENAKELAGVSDIAEEDLTVLYDVETEMGNKVKYDVKEAKETDDKNYVVTVEVQPVDIVTKFSAGMEAKAAEVFKDATEIPSNKEMIDFIADYLKECCQDVTYGDPVTVEVAVTHDDDGVYSVSEADIQKLEDQMIPGE